jgi:signal peptidase I
MTRRRKIGLSVVAALAVVLGFLRFVVSPSIVVGDSMAPTLESWDLCWMGRVHDYRPRRGEIVMFRTADDPPLYFVKRVVGLPGDTVWIDRGVVSVNGSALQTPRLDPSWELPRTTLSDSKILVAADNPRYGYAIVASRLVRARLLWHWRWKR